MDQPEPYASNERKILCCIPALSGFDGTSQLFIDFLRAMTRAGHAVDCAVLASGSASSELGIYGEVRRVSVYHHPQDGSAIARQLYRVRRRVTPRRIGGMHFCPPGYLRMLQAEFALAEYDLLVACGSSFAAVPALVPCPSLLDMHELFTLKQETLALYGVELLNPFVSWAEELASLSAFDALWCPSTQIKETLARALPEKTLLDRHMSHEGVVPADYVPADRSDPARPRILFVGSTARENHPGLRIFLREIFPAIRAAVPGVRFEIVGWRKEDLFAGIDLRGVHALGRLETRAEVLRMFEEASVVVIPRFLGGLTIKGVEALTLGKATVGHPLAFSGCYRIENWREAAIAGNSGEFTVHVVRLLNNPQLRRDLGARARAFALREFDPARVYASVGRLLERRADEGLGFDLDQHLGHDQAAHLHH